MTYPILLIVDSMQVAPYERAKYAPEMDIVAKSIGSALHGYRFSGYIDATTEERRAHFGTDRAAEWFCYEVQLRTRTTESKASTADAQS